MKKTIGILSGSGPEAGLYICHRIHHYLQNHYNAVQDCDYTTYILYNRPLLGFDETGIGNFEIVLQDFQKAISELDNMGISYIGIACNTLHLLLEYLPNHILKKIVNMVEETIIFAVNEGLKKVLILGSHTTNKKELYANYCKKYNLEYININDREQKEIDIIIEKVMGGNQKEEDSIFINNLISHYITTKGIDGFILGCTELPLAFQKNLTDIFECNSNDILSQKLVDLAKQ